MNEHIGRLQAIGFGPELTPGTGVDATAWAPKISGILKPEYEKAVDESAYGRIEGVADSQTVKNRTKVELEGIVRDKIVGHFLKAALGETVLCKIITLTGLTGGSAARGDVVTSATDSWAGKIEKIFKRGATTYYAVSTTSGTLTDSGTDLTNGTWTAGSWATIAGVNGHFFRVKNDNHHPSYTFYGVSPVGPERASYCLMETLDFEVAVGDFMKVTSSFIGKKSESTSPQTPAYIQENPFLAKHASVKFADTEAGLNDALVVPMQSFKLTVEKNPTDIQDLGDVDISSIHNQRFNVMGDLEAIYNSNVLRSLVADSTKKACRFELNNDETTPLATGLYPSLIFDFSRLSFSEWDPSNDNDAIATQTLGYEGEFDVNTGMMCEALLLNSQVTAY